MRKMPTLCCCMAIALYSIFTVAPVQSSAGALFLCEKLPGPTAPAKPASPAKPSLSGKQEAPAPPAPIPKHTPQPAAKNASAPRETKPIEKKAPNPTTGKTENPEKSPREPRTDDLASPPEETPPAIATKKAEQQRFAIDWFKNSVFFLLIFAVCGAIVYIHRKHPPTPKHPAPTLHTPDLSRIRHAALPDLEPSGAVKNKSLLEQLVKYDMETYGEIRSSLTYDQPAYIESLIRKYGHGDKEKTSRALHLYYQNRNKT